MQASQPPCIRLTTGEFDGIRTRMTAIGAISQEDLAGRKTALRMLLFDVFTRYFSGYKSGSSQVPLWLDVLCAQVRRDGSFVEGSEKLFAMTDRSREHVCRSMKKYMGVTVSEFINDLRLNYITSMLRSSDHTIAQIVFESGFNNLSWASELFKNRYGMSMGEFRKQKMERSS